MDCTITLDTAEADQKIAALEAKLGWLDSIADAQHVADNWPRDR
jgi:hypothetical protein